MEIMLGLENVWAGLSRSLGEHQHLFSGLLGSLMQLNASAFSSQYSHPSTSSPSASSPSVFSQASSSSSSPDFVSTTSSSSSTPSSGQLQMLTLFGWELSIAELCMIFLPILCYWAYSTLLYVLSHLNLTLVELHRIPTNQPRRPKNRVTVSKVLWTVAFQHVVQAIVALVVVVLTRPADVANWKMEPVWLVLAKFWIGTIILDTYQYWLHRAAHTYPFLYKNFHSWHHQLTAPYAFGALYNHPLEGLMMDTVGGALPSLLLDMHPWTSCIFYCIATLKTVDDHCGYSWPLSPFRLLGRNDAEYHDIHHWGKGIKYNFSQPFYTFWDRIMGTEYHAAMERLEEVEMQKKAVAEALAAEEKKSLPKSKSSLGGSPAAVPNVASSRLRQRRP